MQCTFISSACLLSKYMRMLSQYALAPCQSDADGVRLLLYCLGFFCLLFLFLLSHSVVTYFGKIARKAAQIHTKSVS